MAAGSPFNWLWSPSGMTVGVAAIAALATLLAFIASCVRAYRRLAHVPGPKWMGVTNLIMARKMYGGNMHYDLLELKNKYGPIVRTGPNMVIVSDPNVIRMMSAARSEYARGPYYKAVRINPHVDNIFSMTDDRLHKMLKSKMGPGYSGREMGGFEPGIDKHVSSFVDLIERKYISTPGEYRPMDLAIKCNYFALDVISELGFGAAFGFLKEDRDLYQYNEITRQFFPFVMFMSNVPFLLSMLGRWPLSSMGPTAGDAAGFGRLMQFAASFVDSRLTPGSKPGSDMIQAFIDSGLTRDELMQEVFVETVAGSDTTATAVRSTMLCLLGNPVALARLRKEIDEGIATGTISSPIKDNEARQMPYLQAVIREGIRMFPPATGVLSKEVPAGGDNILGYDMPAGVQVGHNICGLLRMPELFGADAEVFRPERWLEAEGEPERLKEMIGGVELVFGYGKFQCLGRTIAQMELNKIFVELLRRFDFHIVHVDRPMRLLSAAMLIMDDFWVRVSQRADSLLC
ncbi:cytochrome p450 [Hirsutella rhossiliensis]|uniref:Cytochrome p450 domain-containing protein n=1 Tax=Hirsutella rhossiliensis TaxID=111463 RepID=A0A9P8MX27_9HYPO|nr:cytochrome p450 domain-containing protein [Hirsutella rhossiliensis]KAH0961979.1 cytochrome p450 domain-containing protein [Hirsutella rhossiliensis]